MTGRSNLLVSSSGLTPGDVIPDVDPTSPGNQPGVFGFDAFDTIQQAVDVASVGGQVSVNAGTYKENVTIDKDLALSGLGNDPADVLLMPPAVGAGPHGLTLASPAGNITLRNLLVMGFTGDGVHMTSVDNADVERVHSVANGGHGFFVDSFFDVFFDSTLAENNGGDGMHLTGGGTLTVSGALSVGNDPGLFVSGAAAYTDSGSNYSGNADGGIVLEDITGDVMLTNITANDNDSDGNGTGDGLLIRDSADADSVAVGGTVTISGGSFADTNAAPLSAVQGNGIVLMGDIAGGATVIGTTATGNTDAGLSLHGVVALVQGNDFNANTIGVLIEPGNGTDSRVDLGQGSSGTNFTGLGTSSGGNDFFGYAIGSGSSATHGAIVNLNNNPPNDAAGPQGLPFDVPAVGNSFASSVWAAIEQVVFHDFDDPSRGLVDFVTLSDLAVNVVPAAINENQAVTLTASFDNSPKNHTVTIDWGDGQSDSLVLSPGTFGISISHTYLDDVPSGTLSDTYPISVTVTDEDGETLTDNSQSVRVQNVDPFFTSLSLSPSTVVSGGISTLSGTFGDPGILDQFSLDVDWDGDGIFEDMSLPVSGGTFSFGHAFVQPPGTHDVNVRIRDDDGGATSAVLSVTITEPSPGTFVQSVHLFYNNSLFDGNNAGADANDDDAIALDKFPFIPGQTSTFGSISSYDKGINGVILYVQDLPDHGADVGADNFDILVGTTDDLNTWAAGPAPQVTVAPGVGPGGADRVTLIFPDDVLEDTYVAIRMLQGAETGLAQTETYLFESVVGETGQAAVPATSPRSPRTSRRWPSSAPSRSPTPTTSTATARSPCRTSSSPPRPG